MAPSAIELYVEAGIVAILAARKVREIRNDQRRRVNSQSTCRRVRASAKAVLMKYAAQRRQPSWLSRVSTGKISIANQHMHQIMAMKK